jgi:molybdenum cofactor sulfurtransferase
MERFAQDMVANLYGNPHSTSVAAQSTSKTIESIRLRLLDYFNADPDHFDLVFTANATAGIKLVADAFRESENGFWFGYHYSAHTSIVGVREVARSHRCFDTDDEVEEWIRSASPLNPQGLGATGLFAYPAQSNMNGKRLPLDWCQKVRNSGTGRTYSLLDAAGLASTTRLNLGAQESAPDFTALSLYKIFGFPDLGALIVRKSAAHVFNRRKYFGGGTVDMVICGTSPWHARKSKVLHEALEDGSLPIHNILAIQPAIDTYEELFDSPDRVAKHCAFLARRLHGELSRLCHSNGRPVCRLYHDKDIDFYNLRVQGPVVAFNLRDSSGCWIGTTEVEKLVSIKNIQLRTGGLCNPGGIASALNLSPHHMKSNFSRGQRCGNEHDIMRGEPTGMIRASLGPANTLADVEFFVSFIEEFFVERTSFPLIESIKPTIPEEGMAAPTYTVESLMVYPIKSCGGWSIPFGKRWRVHPEGLAWDREWCLILAGSGNVMSQKRFPKMALIRPVIDLDEGLLRISFVDKTTKNFLTPLHIPLYLDPQSPLMSGGCRREANVCGDDIAAKTYSNPNITNFFSQALGVACHLGRFPPGGTLASSRHAKTHLQPQGNFQVRRSFVKGSVVLREEEADESETRPILLSNESPVLTISRSSLNRLNEQIKVSGGKAVRTEAFRANIVLAEKKGLWGHQEEQPYLEDKWHMMQIGREYFDFLGPCRRCQMVCIDQETGERHQEPFVTLAKTRRFDGKVFFGQHSCHVPTEDSSQSTGSPSPATIAAGDPVVTYQDILRQMTRTGVVDK